VVLELLPPDEERDFGDRTMGVVLTTSKLLKDVDISRKNIAPGPQPPRSSTIRERPITCFGDKFDRYRRLVARCSFDGESGRLDGRQWLGSGFPPIQ
jgi:hypothetical protein